MTGSARASDTGQRTREERRRSYRGPHKENVVMVHGMWTSGQYWQKFQSFFGRRGYRCFYPTLRFHDAGPTGEPDPRLGSTSLLDYVCDLEGEMDKFEAPPILMGHSMGGLLALMLATRRQVRALVLLNPAPSYGMFCLRPSVLWSFRCAATTWCFWKKPIRQSRAEAVYGQLHLLDREGQQAAYDSFVHESGRAIFEIGLSLLDVRRAARVDTSRVRCPVLVVGASQDRITPAPIARAVARKCGANYREFPDHAHPTAWEPGWRDVAGHISEWLDQALGVEREGAPAQLVSQGATSPPSR
ncbi:MAG: alpha/beta hydrolase [Chloroflexota bacterium]